MNNWERSKIGEIAQLIKDGTHGTHKNVENGPYLLSAQNIENGNININESDRKISNEDFDSIHRSYKLQDDDILVTIVGSLGRCAMLKNYSNNFTFQRSVAIIRFNKTKIIPKFAYYQIQTNAFQKKLARRESKGAQGGVYLGELAKIQIHVPDLETQQKIVQILDTWNTSINKLKELSEKEKSYFDSQCKLLLSQNNNQTINYKLSDICSYKKGSGLSKEMLTNKGLPCILYGELYTHYDYLIDKVYSKIPITTIGVKSTMDDILIPASTTTNGKDLAIASVIKQPDVLLGGDINIFRIKDTNTVDGTFLALYLRYIKWRKMASRAQGITIVHLYGKDLLDLKIELPPLGIQKKIVSVINCQREKINIINDYIIKLEQQYKYLLNHLISGDFDLTNIKLEKGKEQQ